MVRDRQLKRFVDVVDKDCLRRPFTEKRCSVCEVTKPLVEFTPLVRGKYGRTARCRECLRRSAHEWRTKNPEKAAARKRRYRELNQERVNRQERERYQANKEKENARGRKYKATHRERVEQKCREWCLANRDRINKRNREWRAANSEKVLERERRRRSNPRERLNRGISSCVRQSLKNGSKSKQRWEKLVGYTVEQLVNHLEGQFDDKMTWENYGTYWHVDHIVPIAAHNFKSPSDDDFKRAWGISNLRPLEAKENLRKGATLLSHFQPSLL